MTAARRTLEVAMNEQAWQQQIIDLARLCGWRVHHTRPARTDKGWRTPLQGDPGFPDLLLAHPDGLAIAAELKTTRGKVGADQRAWLGLLAHTTLEAELWRPNDWPRIEQVLRGRLT